MNILAIDTSQQGLGLAIQTDKGAWFHREAEYRLQAEHLLPVLADLLQQANIGLEHLHLLGISIGPGAFTGLRIGISAAQALALAHSIPIVPVSTLRWIAQTAWRVSQTEDIVVVQDARMHEVYWGRYLLRKGAIIMPEPPVFVSAPLVIAFDDFHGVAAGDAWQHYGDSLPAWPHTGVQLGELSDLLILVEAYAQMGYTCEPQNLNPAYVRDKVVSS